MRRRFRRWFPVAIVLAVTVIAATAWAKTTQTTGTVVCFDVDSQGSLGVVGTVVLITLSINEKTRAYHGTVHARVINSFGNNVAYSDSGAIFGPGGITKSKYTVKANGDATLTIHGVFPPAP